MNRVYMASYQRQGHFELSLKDMNRCEPIEKRYVIKPLERILVRSTKKLVVDTKLETTPLDNTIAYILQPEMEIKSATLNKPNGKIWSDKNQIISRCVT